MKNMNNMILQEVGVQELNHTEAVNTLGGRPDRESSLLYDAAWAIGFAFLSMTNPAEAAMKWALM